MTDSHTELPAGEARFENLLEAHAGAMYRQALRMLGNREDAEDAVQDAMMRIWIHRRSFEHRSRLSTWIFRITYNACRALQVRRRRYPIPEANLARGLGRGDAVEGRTSAEESERGGQDIARLLSLLPPIQAAALSLFYVEDLEYKEIAHVLEIPPGSVATAIHRGKQKLREMLRHGQGGLYAEL